MPLLSSGLAWQLDYEPTRLLATVVEQLLDGDYNNDGVVDAADYSVWRDNLGAPAGALPNDPNASPVGPAQYATWVANLGSSAAPSVAIPEPASVALAILAAAAGILRARRSGPFASWKAS